MYPLVDGLLGLFSSSTPFQNWSLPARPALVCHTLRAQNEATYLQLSRSTYVRIGGAGSEELIMVDAAVNQP